MTDLIVRQWEGCEDCQATGGQGRNCVACGGTGRLPANQAARDEVARVDEGRRAAIWNRVWRDWEDDRAD